MGDDIQIVETGCETTAAESASTTSLPDREQSLPAESDDSPFIEPPEAYVALVTHYAILSLALLYAIF